MFLDFFGQAILTESPVTWPKAGIVSDFDLYLRPKWERTTGEIDSGFLPTPRAGEPGRTNIGYGGSLNDFVKGTRPDLWPTPQARDHFPPHSPEYVERKRDEGHGMRNLNDEVAMFPTPRASDGDHGSPNQKSGSGAPSLSNIAAHYPTPTVQDAENNAGPSQSERNTPPLNAVAGGMLNPDWVEWIMNWPHGWTSLDPLEPSIVEAWEHFGSHAWIVEPPIPRTVSGMQNRNARLRALGNGQVPLCAAAAFILLLEGILDEGLA